MYKCMNCLFYLSITILTGCAFLHGCTSVDDQPVQYRKVKRAMAVPPGFDPTDPGGLYDLCPGLEDPGDVPINIPPEDNWPPPGACAEVNPDSSDGSSGIDLFPGNCDSNICCVLAHELDHTDQVEDLWNSCDMAFDGYSPDVEKCFVCTFAQTQFLYEAEANTTGWEYCQENPSGDDWDIIPEGSTHDFDTEDDWGRALWCDDVKNQGDEDGLKPCSAECEGYCFPPDDVPSPLDYCACEDLIFFKKRPSDTGKCTGLCEDDSEICKAVLKPVGKSESGKDITRCEMVCECRNEDDGGTSVEDGCTEEDGGCDDCDGGVDDNDGSVDEQDHDEVEQPDGGQETADDSQDVSYGDEGSKRLLQRHIDILLDGWWSRWLRADADGWRQ